MPTIPGPLNLVYVQAPFATKLDTCCCSQTSGMRDDTRTWCISHMQCYMEYNFIYTARII